MSKNKKTEEPTLIADEVYSEVLKKFMGDAGNTPWADMLMSGLSKRLISKYEPLIKGAKGDRSALDNIKEMVKNEISLDYVIRAFDNNPNIKDELYNKSYERLKGLADSGNISYGELLCEIYSDENYLNEIFVRLVEEQEGVEITSGKQLQDVTEIVHTWTYWDKDRGFLSEEDAKSLAKEQKRPLKSYEATKKQTKEEATRELEDTFIKAMYYRYFTTLEMMLKAGAKYKDLLQITPSQFNLPETWSECLGSDQYSTILWAIYFELLTENAADLMLMPDLRSIAQEIEAPYSVLMDAYKKPWEKS